MSQERVLETLKGFGFSEVQAQVYVFLSKRGPQRGTDISRALKINKQQLYSSLKILQSKGVVSVTLEHPARFASVTFDKVLDSFVKAKMEEAQTIVKKRNQILSDWQSIVVGASDDASAKFMVLEGRPRIYSRIQQMILESKNRILTVSTVTALAQADELGLFTSSYDHVLNSNIQFKFLAEINAQNAETMKNLLGELSRHKVIFQGKDPLLGLKSFPRLVVKDEDEILLFLKPTTDTTKIEEEDTCLWTNCRTLISGFATIFEELWRNSVDIQKKILEVKNGGLSRTTHILTDPRKAEGEYFQKVQSAEEEIVVLTSSQGLLELWEENDSLRRLSAQGVAVRILAPIVRENWEIAKQFLKFSTVKHVPASYVGMTIIDGKHLFQAKALSVSPERRSLAPYFYTDDFDYVEKIRNAINEIWFSAQVPSNVALEFKSGPLGYSVFPLTESELETMPSSNTFTIVETKPPGTITEQDILNKIMRAKKHRVRDTSKDINVVYASQGSAIIHPPSQFNLPDMLIRVDHIEKQSSFGEGDAIEIHLRLKTPRGLRFVAVGGLGDNPKGVIQRKLIYAGTPLEKNYQLVGKDKLQLRVFGNTLFVGWAVPIPLAPLGSVLPPGCLMFEGYGNIKTRSISIITNSGMKIETEQNWFDAFVTFMHPASKYSGPGTDGFFIRDLITKMTPPDKKHA